MLTSLLSALRAFVSEHAHDADGAVFTTPAFIASSKITSLDINSVLRHIDSSNLSRKLRGFVPEAASVAAPTATAPTVSHVASFHAVTAFLSALLMTQDDGRVLLKPEAVDGTIIRPAALKFILLNAAARFQTLVSAARSVILIGGTLQPLHALVYQLLRDVRPARIHTLACTHVVPPDNVLTVCLGRGPSASTPFNFSFSARDSSAQISELGKTIANFASLIPAASGVVCFFPSYDFEARVWAQWATDGCAERISAKCRVCMPSHLKEF